MWGPLIRTVALAAVAVVAGCGGGGSDVDPASAVPADAPFYLEAVVRPGGSLRDDALAAARKVLATDDPEGEIRASLLLPDVDYERDVEPWLGERAAIWVAGDRPVVLLAATDTDEAWASLEELLGRTGETLVERSYRDSEYLVGADGAAGGIVGELVAIGPEALYKRTVDAAEGESLADADAYVDAVGALPDERLAHFWADTAGLLELAVSGDPRLDRLRSLVPAGELPPVAGAFLANGERLAVELGTDMGVSGTPLLGELPADSWLAAGAADVGESARDAIDRFGGPLGGAAINGWLKRELGLDLDRDLLDWIGDAAVFVRGTTPMAADAGVVIRPTDEDRAADAFGRIVGAVQQARGVAARPLKIAGADQAFEIEEPSSPRPLVLARGSGLVVAASGTSAAEAALGSGGRLADTEAFAEAEQLVATEPGLLISIPALLELVDAETRRRLEPFTVLAAGGEDGAARLVAGLR